MRTRTRIMHNVIGSGLYSYDRTDNLPFPDPGNVVVEHADYPTGTYTTTSFPDSSQETITDEELKHKGEGYCLHDAQKTTFYELGTEGIRGQVLAGLPATFHKYHVTGGYFAYTYARVHTAALFPSITLNGVDWERSSYEALKKMMPRFSEGNQFFNDLLELHQIKSLLSPYGAAKSLIGRVSNAVLWYSFGVRPVVQTIIAVRSLMRELRGKIQDIRRRAKRLQTRHYARPLDIPATAAFPSGDDRDPHSLLPILNENVSDFRYTTVWVKSYWIVHPVYHATLKFRYDVSRFSDLDLELRAWGEAMDLLDPVRILWNAIPFSFVLDWFTNIGDWVDQLLNESAIPIVIEDFSHSAKWSYKTDMIISWWATGAYTAPIATGEVSHYERRRDIPSTSVGLEFHSPSAAAYVLGAALIGQASSRRVLPPRIRKQLPYLRFKAGTFVR